MSDVVTKAVQEALGSTRFPGFSRDLISLGYVRNAAVTEGVAVVTLAPTGLSEAQRDDLLRGVTEAVSAIAGVTSVEVGFGAESAGSSMRSLPVAGAKPAAAPEKSVAPIARSIIGVASGKGGVGKSTVAVNLAVSLARAGARVGFLDADVHGPSAPLLFGLVGKRPEVTPGEGRPLPIASHGVGVMSMGFFVERDNAVIWRGPIVGNFIRQLLNDVSWGDLDVLVIDFPPGTGDAQLTISQTLKMTGSIIVSTSNELALVDASKAVAMFKKVNVPVLGLVENMSRFACPHCGEESEIYGPSRVGAAARELGIPLLASVPIDPDVVADSDAGRPVVVARPDCAASRAYGDIASSLGETLGLEPSPSGETPADTPPPRPDLSSFLRRFGGGR